jgi:hypothetical protein
MAEFNREDVEDIQHFPTEKNYRHQDYHNGHEFAEAEAAFAGLHAAGSETEDVESRKSEDDGPEDVVNVLACAAKKSQPRHTDQQGAKPSAGGICDDGGTSDPRYAGDQCCSRERHAFRDAG